MKYDLDEQTREVLAAIARGDDVECEFFFVNGNWVDALYPLSQIDSGYKVRLKPHKININGHEVPEPMRVAPAVEASYYTPDVHAEAYPFHHIWGEDIVDKEWLAGGLCHATKEGAVAHAKALLSFTKAKNGAEIHP
jgi:hypothetical protein